MARTLKEELFDYLLDFMRYQNANYNGEYSYSKLVDYANDVNLPEYLEGIYGSLVGIYEHRGMSKELVRALQNAIRESPSFFTDIFHEAFCEAAEVVSHEC